MDLLPFLDILDSSLSEAELAALGRRFNVEFKAFPGATKRDKTREFLGFVGRQGRVDGLADLTVAMRPDLSTAVARLYESDEPGLAWLDGMVASERPSADSGLTWSGSSAKGQGPQGDAAAAGPTGSPPTNSSARAANPYTPGAMVTEEGMFFGRHAEREALRRQLQDGKHVAVTGERGIGGSSLLHALYRDTAAGERALVAYVDLKDPAHYTAAGLLNAAWSQWWARVKPGNQVQVHSLAEFVTAVRKLNTAGYRPTLFLDELEQLLWRPGEFDDGFFAAWHELGREKLLGFALSAHANPAELFATEGYHTNFHELFEVQSLGLLSEQAARDLLAVPPGNAGLAIPDGAVEYLYLHAGPQPFFLHLAGYYLFDALKSGTYSRGEVIRQFEIAAEPYWHEIWDGLTPLAQSYYPTAPARPGEGMGGRQLRILSNRGLVIGDDGGYRPFSEGFARWLARVAAATEAAAAATQAAATTTQTTAAVDVAA